MVRDIRIEWDEDKYPELLPYLLKINSIRGMSFTVTPLPQVSKEDILQRLYHAGQLTSMYKDKKHLVPGDVTFISASQFEDLAKDIAQRINGDKEEICEQCKNPNLKGVHTCNKYKPTPQFPQLLDMNISTPFAAPDMVARETINQIITYLQQKDNKSEH